MLVHSLDSGMRQTDCSLDEFDSDGWSSSNYKRLRFCQHQSAKAVVAIRVPRQHAWRFGIAGLWRSLVGMQAITVHMHARPRLLHSPQTYF